MHTFCPKFLILLSVFFLGEISIKAQQSDLEFLRLNSIDTTRFLNPFRHPPAFGEVFADYITNQTSLDKNRISGFKGSFYTPEPDTSFIYPSKNSSLHVVKSIIAGKLMISGFEFEDSLKLSFSQTIIKNELQLIHSNFSRPVTFRDTRFEVSPLIIGSRFRGVLKFEDCVFTKNLKETIPPYTPEEPDPEYQHLERVLLFGETNRIDSLVFDGSYFVQGGSLIYGYLPVYLSLNKIRTDKTIDLRSAYRSPWHISQGVFCRINLFDAPIEQIEFSYENFRLWIPEVTNQRVFEQCNKLYESLLLKFRENGQLTSYEILDREYREFKLTKSPQSSIISVFINFINKVWNNYGYNKERIWGWTSLLFLFFWIVNWLRFPHNYLGSYKTESLEKALTSKGGKGFELKEARKKTLNFRCLDLAFYYTVIIFFGLKLETTKFNFTNLRGVLYIGIQYILGVICLAYLANFVISN